MPDNYVRLKDANPRVNPGWMSQGDWEKAVANTNGDLNKKVRISIPR